MFIKNVEGGKNEACRLLAPLNSQDLIYSIESHNYISLVSIREEFFEYVNRLDDSILENYAKRFREWRYQKVYLKFEDKEGKIHLYLGCKRGNTKHLKKIRRKLKKIKDEFKESKINRDYSDIAFITLTCNREKFMNPIDAWLHLSHYTNDFLENLKKKLRRIGNGIIAFLKAYELHDDLFPHVHLIIKLKRPLRTFMHRSKKEKRWISRFVEKRSLFEWNYGFTDARAPTKANDVISYMTKYCVKNYFSDYPGQEQKNGKNTNKQGINMSDKTLTILWLFRIKTISHSRLPRLDVIDSKLTYSMTFKGLIIIEYTTYFEEFIRKHYKLKEIEYFKLDKDGKLMQINNQICTQPSKVELGNMFT